MTYVYKLNKVLDNLYGKDNNKTFNDLVSDYVTANTYNVDIDKDITTLKDWLNNDDYDSEDITIALSYRAFIDGGEQLDDIIHDYDNGDIISYNLGNINGDYQGDDYMLGSALVDMDYYEVSDDLARYVDYESMGHDFDLENGGTFVTIGNKRQYIFRQ